MDLLQSMDDFPIQGNVPSVTVQTVLLHPSLEGTVYWVLNREEIEGVKQGVYNTLKPRGWGNPGGGVEVADQIDTRGIPRSFEETIISCGKRELIGETGFINFEFEPYLPSRVPFLAYIYPYGHIVLTLLGRLHDFQSILADEVESEEIIDGSWFNLASSPVELFQNERDLPYWSHVRRTIMIFDHMACRMGEDNVVRNLHPLWRLAFPIATKDHRFPKNGYLIPPMQWYKIMRIFIESRVDTVDLDLIYKNLRSHIEGERIREEKSNPRLQYHSNLRQRSYSKLDDGDLAAQHEKRISEYEEGYRLWAEEMIGA